MRNKLIASLLLLSLYHQVTWSWVTSPPCSRKSESRLTRLQLAAAADETPSSSQNDDESTDSSARRKLLKDSAALAAAAAAGTLTAAGFSLPASAYTSDESKRIEIFEKTAPSVVFIDTFAERRDAFSTNIMEVPLGSGSGFVWDQAGHIVTNFHVVRNAQAAQVAILLTGKENVVVSKNKQQSSLAPATASSSTTSSSSNVITPYTSMRPTAMGSNSMRSVFKARVVGVDPGKDIAVLKVDAPESVLHPLQLGTSTGLKVGQQSLAIGNPFGLDHTLTLGIISGTGREVRSPIGRPITNVIQTDAAINPGNSGGPLLDSAGKLIGMNTAIYSPSGGSAGIGFAIPIDTVKAIVETLIRDGRVVRPVLGISLLGSKQARALGIGSGVLVLEVPEGSAAAKAGLKGTRRTESGLVEIGDVIAKVGDTDINTESDLFQALEDLQPGDTVTVTVLRIVAEDDQLQVKEISLDVVLQASTDAEKTFQIFQYPAPMQQR